MENVKLQKCTFPSGIHLTHAFSFVEDGGGGRHLRPSRPPGGPRPPAGGRDLLGTPKTVPGVSAGPQNHKPFGDEAGWQPLRPRLAGRRVPFLRGLMERGRGGREEGGHFRVAFLLREVERGLAVLVRGAVGRAARDERLAGTPRFSAGP